MKSAGLMIAKKESSRLKGKNFKDFCGKPMFVWNLEKMLKIFDKVYISSDYSFILEKAAALGVIPIKRPDELCRSKVPNISVYKHAFGYMNNPDIIVAIQADSPTIDKVLIKKAKTIMENFDFQELMTAYPAHGYSKQQLLYGSIWAITAKKLKKYKDPRNPSPEILLVDDSVDIHTKADLIKAKNQLNKKWK